jgi:hypothetical protein
MQRQLNHNITEAPACYEEAALAVPYARHCPL